MSEMLGNQYFLSRNFTLAQKEFEENLKKDPSNLLVKKKLIICYLQKFDITNAIDQLIPILTYAPEIITKTDLEKDDCPCEEIIDKITKECKDMTEDRIQITLGILWLFCDVQKALEHFDSIPESSKYNDIINRIVYNLNIFN